MINQKEEFLAATKELDHQASLVRLRGLDINKILIYLRHTFDIWWKSDTTNRRQSGQGDKVVFDVSLKDTCLDLPSAPCFFSFCQRSANDLCVLQLLSS